MIFIELISKNYFLGVISNYMAICNEYPTIIQKVTFHTVLRTPTFC